MVHHGKVTVCDSHISFTFIRQISQDNIYGHSAIVIFVCWLYFTVHCQQNTDSGHLSLFKVILENVWRRSRLGDDKVLPVFLGHVTLILWVCRFIGMNSRDFCDLQQLGLNERPGIKRDKKYVRAVKIGLCSKPLVSQKTQTICWRRRLL